MGLRGEQRQTDASTNEKPGGNTVDQGAAAGGGGVHLLASMRVFSQDGFSILCEERGALSF